MNKKWHTNLYIAAKNRELWKKFKQYCDETDGIVLHAKVFELIEKYMKNVEKEND